MSGCGFVGVALCVVGVASRAESPVHVVITKLYRMASATNISLESVVIPTKPHQPLSFNFQEVIWAWKGVFPSWQNCLSSSFLSCLFDGV